MEQLSVSRAAAIGHLHMLWWWCIDYAPDGDLTRFTPLQLAKAADWMGDHGDFVKAMLAVGLLDETAPNKYAIHDWLHFCGQLMDKRLARLAAKRPPMAADRTPTNHTYRTQPTEPNPTLPNPPAAEQLTAQGEPAIPDPKTEPARALVVWFKVLKGIPWDDVRWDNDWMPRVLPQAKELLDRCDGKYEYAYGCLDHYGRKWSKLDNWGFDGIIKRALEWTAAQRKKESPDVEESHFTRFFGALDRQRASRKSSELRGAAETAGRIVGNLTDSQKGAAPASGRKPNGNHVPPMGPVRETETE